MDTGTIPVVLTLCHGRSGSTLLDAILDSHPSIAGVGEVLRLHRAIERGEQCACGEPAAECPLWGKVLERVDINDFKLPYRSGLSFLLGRKDFFHVRGGMPEQMDADAYRAHVRGLYRAILDISGKKVVSDSSKSIDRAEMLLKDPALRVIIVHLVRDGRGVANSYRKDTGEPVLHHMWAWVKANLKLALLKARNPRAAVLFMRYGDLARDPQGQVGRIVEALGLPRDEKMLNFRDFVHHTIGGNPRFRTRTSSDITPDESWRHEMSLLHKLLFIPIGGWLNAYYHLRSQ